MEKKEGTLENYLLKDERKNTSKVVCEGTKNAKFAKLDYEVLKYNDERVDIVQNIIFNDENKLIKFVQGIQSASPIDSSFLPIPDDMPGYDDKVIMASGSFVQGSSIELSCDGPIRPPYIAYMQGSISYYYGKYAVINAVNKLIK